MSSSIFIGSLLLPVLKVVSAQSVTCSTLGATSCFHELPTTAQLESLISELCASSQEDLEATLPDGGVYQVTANPPGVASDASCTAALNNIITVCDATGFWATAVYETGGITYSITPCDIA